MKAKTVIEHNGDWKNCMVKNPWKQKKKLNIMVSGKMHGIKPMNEKQKLNIMVTEIMYVIKPLNEKQKLNIMVTEKLK